MFNLDHGLRYYYLHIMLTGALLTTAKNWNQARYSLTDKQLKKIGMCTQQPLSKIKV